MELVQLADLWEENQECLKQHLGRSDSRRFGARWVLMPTVPAPRFCHVSRIRVEEREVEGLLAAGARVQTHDPKATDSARVIFGDRLMYAADPYSAAHGADALIVMTEWLVYRNPDFERVRKLVRRPLLIDGRNLYDPERMATLGFEYHGIGRAGK